MRTLVTWNWPWLVVTDLLSISLSKLKPRMMSQSASPRRRHALMALLTACLETVPNFGPMWRYRSIDTAAIYGNERGVGRAIHSCGVPREQLFVTIPKSVKAQRIAENADIFDFGLTDSEMAAVAALDCDRRNGADPFNFSF